MNENFTIFNMHLMKYHEPPHMGNQVHKVDGVTSYYKQLGLKTKLQDEVLERIVKCPQTF